MSSPSSGKASEEGLIDSPTNETKSEEKDKGKKCPLKDTNEECARLYFDYYGQASNQMNMLQDEIRTAEYERAVSSNPSDFEDKMIMDVGAGSGILSFFAAQNGAGLALAVEASSSADLCALLASKNPLLASRVKVLKNYVEDDSLSTQIHEILKQRDHGRKSGEIIPARSDSDAKASGRSMDVDGIENPGTVTNAFTQKQNQCQHHVVPAASLKDGSHNPVVSSVTLAELKESDLDGESLWTGGRLGERSLLPGEESVEKGTNSYADRENCSACSCMTEMSSVPLTSATSTNGAEAGSEPDESCRDIPGSLHPVNSGGLSPGDENSSACVDNKSQKNASINDRMNKVNLHGSYKASKEALEEFGEQDRVIDTIISEPIGTFLLNERMIETFLYARDRYLKEGGKMYPSGAYLYLAPFNDVVLYNEVLNKCQFWKNTNFHGVDLTSAYGSAINQVFQHPVLERVDPSCLVAPAVCIHINFLQVSRSSLQELVIDLVFQAKEAVLIHGLCGWFDVLFDGTEKLCGFRTAPWAPATHWHQMKFLFKKPLALNYGQVCTGKFHMKANEQQSYFVESYLEIPHTRFKVSSETMDLKSPEFRWNCANEKSSRNYENSENSNSSESDLFQPQLSQPLN